MGAIDVTPILKIIAAGTVLAIIVIYFKTKLERWAHKKVTARKHIEWQEEQERRADYRARKAKK